MKVVVYLNPRTGITAVFYPAYNYILRPVGETDDECLARCMAKALPDDLTRYVIDADTLPTDRYFRNAWEWED